MKITQKVLDTIFENIDMTPPEMGGILGTSGNNDIDYVRIDPGVETDKCCSYAPDVKVLNQTIRNWKNMGVEFKGIFHSHYYGVRSLSEGDKKYISVIMGCMPLMVNSLYFPIALMPNKELVIYKAYRYKDTVKIIHEDLQVI